jgi:hypothetical protein
MKVIVTESMKSVYGKMNKNKKLNTFEVIFLFNPFKLFGYDFMIDEDFDVTLIEVNTNPCLDLACPLLARLIPNLLENTLR